MTLQPVPVNEHLTAQVTAVRGRFAALEFQVPRQRVLASVNLRAFRTIVLYVIIVPHFFKIHYICKENVVLITKRIKARKKESILSEGKHKLLLFLISLF